QFETIEFFFALIGVLPLLALFIGLIYWKRWIRMQLGSQRLVGHLVAGYSSARFKIRIILVLVAITLGILAAVNIRQPKQTAATRGNGVDIMFVLDVSKSMLSQDAKPSRLDKAKQFINSLLPKLGNNRAGLVLFAGQAYLQMPLTPDLAAAKMFVSNASVDAVPVQGTVFSEALQLAGTSMSLKEKKYKAVVLITDGEDNDESAGDAARELSEQGVVVFTVGIGSTEGSNIIEPGTDEPKRDYDGNIIVTKLNEQLLQEIASVTRGSYHRLENINEASAAIATSLNSMEKTGYNAGGGTEYRNFFPVIIAVVFVLLVLEIFISERKPVPA
ncbi:MAG TPA: VWA domain-containing protein, partial [Chitinophagaceae bacterium]